MGKKVFDPVEMNKSVSIEECENLKKLINILTKDCMLTKMEYLRFLLLINESLLRMKLEDGVK